MHQKISSLDKSNTHLLVNLAFKIYPAVECWMPFGFPVEPDVYKIKRGCSADTETASQTSFCPSTRLCHQISLFFFIVISFSVLRKTTTCFTESQFFSSALSVDSLSGTTWPPRYPPSAVMTNDALASCIRSLIALAENPPKTTE